MHRVSRVRRCASLVPLTLAAFAAAALPAWAQAWVAPAGLGSVTVAVQTINNTGHTDTDGLYARIGRSVNTRIDIETEYAFTDRLTLSAGLPLVFAKYVDPSRTVRPVLRSVMSQRDRSLFHPGTSAAAGKADGRTSASRRAITSSTEPLD